MALEGYELETEVMAHRYIYYVLNSEVITDFAYDKLEARARRLLPSTSPVHSVGSSLLSSYTSDAVERANYLIAAKD